MTSNSHAKEQMNSSSCCSFNYVLLPLCRLLLYTIREQLLDDLFWKIIGWLDDLLFCRFGPRFPAMSRCYDKGLRCMAMEVAKELDVASIMQEGVYAMVGGPNFESIAEARLLHCLGVDAVGKT